MPKYETAEERQAFINSLKVGDTVFIIRDEKKFYSFYIERKIIKITQKTAFLNFDGKLEVKNSFKISSSWGWFFGGILTDEIKATLKYLETALLIRNKLDLNIDTPEKKRVVKKYY